MAKKNCALFLLFLNFLVFGQSCEGIVKDFMFTDNSFTGICSNGEKLTGYTQWFEEEETGGVFLGSYLDNQPYRGILQITADYEGEKTTFAYFGEFENFGSTYKFKGDIKLGEVLISRGNHDENFELQGFGIKSLYDDSEFDQQIGLFSNGKLTGNASWIKNESSDAVFAKYSREGKLYSKAYLELKNGDIFVLNYRSNIFQNSTSGWSESERRTVAQIKNDLKERQSEYFAFYENLTEEYNAIYEEWDSLNKGNVSGGSTLVRGEIIGWGTGFFVNSNILVTNDHVVKDCKAVTGLLGFDEINLRVVSNDSSNDLALLISDEAEVDSYATIRVRPPLRRGETVISVGFGFGELTIDGQRTIVGEGVKVSEGRVANLSGFNNRTSEFQLTNEIYGGNSGGPLFDDKGNIIGVTVSGFDNDEVELSEKRTLDPTNLNFGIKALTLINFLDLNNIKFEETIIKNKQDVPDIVSSAEEFTVLLRCYE